MKLITCLLAVALLPGTLFAQQKKLGEAASIQSVEIKGVAIPGSRVTAVVTVKLDKGYHVHSNKPSQPEFIPTVLSLNSASGIRAGTIAYPEGKSEKVEGLPKPLSVYEEHFELSIPLGLSGSVKLPATIPAVLSYQACRGAKCYAPQKLKFDITLPAPK